MLNAPFAPILFMVLMLAGLIYRLSRVPAAPGGNGPKSSLARDGGLGGVGFLIPSSQRAEVVALRKAKAKS